MAIAAVELSLTVELRSKTCVIAVFSPWPAIRDSGWFLVPWDAGNLFWTDPI